MKIKRWKRFAFAALLTVFTAFAYHSANVRACTRVAARAQKPHADEVVLRGKGVVRLAGYELNLSFTPEGRFVGLDITAAPESKTLAAG
jgi:hypothetical protein